jgi:hypothetical protein
MKFWEVVYMWFRRYTALKISLQMPKVGNHKISSFVIHPNHVKHAFLSIPFIIIYHYFRNMGKEIRSLEKLNQNGLV